MTSLRFPRGVALVALVLTPSGCNSLFGVDGFTYDGHPAASGGQGGDGGSAGGSGGAQGGSGGEAGAISADISGSVLLEGHQSAVGPEIVYSSRTQAGFSYLAPTIPLSCEHSDAGSCGLWDCGPPVTSRPTAGPIEVTGASHQSPITLTPGSDGFYSSNVVADQAFFEEADEITYVAAGAEVPPFELNVTAPGQVTVTDPALSEGMSIPVSPAFAITWTGTTGGSVEIQLSARDPNDPDHTILAVCIFPVADGTGTVTTEALAALQPYAEHRLMVTNSTWTSAQGVLTGGSSWAVSAGTRRGAVTAVGMDADVWVTLP